ncbi:hypothetical protein J6590_066286 [Homalodisca vitripennis]|nr:hypothetical protein J6590_066286 [Homalodisca vitripennis]
MGAIRSTPDRLTGRHAKRVFATIFIPNHSQLSQSCPSSSVWLQLTLTDPPSSCDLCPRTALSAYRHYRTFEMVGQSLPRRADCFRRVYVSVVMRTMTTHSRLIRRRAAAAVAVAVATPVGIKSSFRLDVVKGLLDSMRNVDFEFPHD